MRTEHTDNTTCQRGSLLRIYDWEGFSGETARCPHCGKLNVPIVMRLDNAGNKVSFLATHKLPI